MTRLVRAELLKLRTTRMLLWLLVTTVALTILSVSATILSSGRTQGTFSLETREGVRNVLGSGWPATTIVLVLGILAMTGEFRHGTINSTLLVTPVRRRLVAAKIMAFMAVGLGFAALSSAVTLAIAIPWLAAKDVSVSIFGADVMSVVPGLLLSTALFSLIGVGLGALVRNQVIAVAGALVWSFGIEGVLTNLVPAVGKWGPVGAASALSGGATSAGALLRPWAGGLLLACYGVVLAAAGACVLLRRDVT